MVLFFDSLLIVTPVVGFCGCSMFCCVLLCVNFGFAIILMGKRERAGCFAWFVFLVFRGCCMDLLAVSSVCLQFVIVVFPDHTHYVCK